MAKNKGGKAKARVPKKIGGMKVPKALRKAGDTLVAQATSPAGLELLAAGLGIATMIASSALERERSRRQPPVTGAPAGDGPALAMREGGGAARPPRASNDPNEIGVALGKMAEAALAGWLKAKS